MDAMKPPNSMEFLVSDRDRLKTLKPGQVIQASVRKQGRDFVLDDLRPVVAVRSPVNTKE